MTKKESDKKYREANKDKIRDYNKNYQEKNKEKIAERFKNYNQLNKDSISEQRKKYKKDNKEKISISNKLYREKNKDKKNAKDRERRESDPHFKLRCNLSTLIRQSLKTSGFFKNSKTMKILGCSFVDFKKHLEVQFELWMNWDNYGSYKLNEKRTWNIDHIIPVSSAKTEEDIIKLNHYTNLRPLCSKHNNEKSNKII